ncbi:leucine-rich repeat receptor-like serine/threonine-protein kinase [Corchorus olitorius]|uniref:Leucine-rich repeat receptor-like serine/threonine-protein kinase n=1 Tax=Corchorus olitorius TaxID=93759 RepID=A0A1R3GEH7_9ROSI|nr:leucine-rich repeat receptor-like serine/threonine-protein kinase [Corchorus olitorius]
MRKNLKQFAIHNVWTGSSSSAVSAPISNSEALIGKEHQTSIHKTEDATLPPIPNAIEIYMAKQLDELPTFSEDVDAVLDIKRAYQVNKSWVGDPCGPKNYTWEGLECNYSVPVPPRIISLGMISASFGSLSAMESLDLSNNHLTFNCINFRSNAIFLNRYGSRLLSQEGSNTTSKEAGGRAIPGVYDDDLARSFEPDALCGEPGIL